MSGTVPFVVGQWVRGERFYGRAAELARLLAGGEARCVWVAGLRRIGKTSLLRHLELLAGQDGRLPLFWDLQGVDDAAELALGFTDALVDAEEQLARHGIALAEVENGSLVGAVGRLLRALEQRGLRLLLLCDEADELVRLAEACPQVVGELGRVLLSSPATAVILTCSPRASARAAAAGEGGPLTATLGAPFHLGVLTHEEAGRLLRQEQLPAGARPPFHELTVEAIRQQCGNHPMLLQLVGRRCLELGNEQEACRQVAADATLEHLFAVDLGLLSGDEGKFLRAVACASCQGADPASTDGSAPRRLLALGLLHAGPDGRLFVPNRFLAHWLRRRAAA
ncbi:MAG TPA: hypothetical protein VGV61_15150 [Thermoanaerobaculia bacterium]|jgi:hypothetical protein|nr:hypothetical protein [Thermoanaerobaculia bacterium]